MRGCHLQSVQLKRTSGDTLVTKLDRLGRNTTDVLATIERLAEMGVHALSGARGR
ncbi:recombinase family protein [Burkholderia ambifaria]|uniref:recombinase family protein n=1 Tax=Burkholderia ambifaria TaxID=152480 RepID=UPI0031FD16EA